MHELWLTSEVLVGGALFIVGFLLGAVFARRRLIARGKALTVCALREAGGDRWRIGLVRYGSTGLDWFRLAGISLRPARRWERTELEFCLGPALAPGERPATLLRGAINADCCYRLTRYGLRLAGPTLTPPRSWL